MDLESSYPQQSTRLGGPLLSHVSERTFDVPMPSQPREKEVHTLFNVTTPAHFHESGSATPYPVDLISRPRKRGRPLGSKSKSRAVGEDTDSSAHRRPVGRPKGSGTKAQQTPVVKKAVGRPRKSKPQISIEFGRVTIPGTFQPSRPPSGLPFPLHRGNSMPNLSGGSPLVSVDPSTRQTLPNPLFAQNPVLPNVSEPTSLSTIEIIPDEDPQRPVELADEDQDEDEETGMSGEGIGVDVGFEENQDEKGDELDPVDENVEDSEYQENTGRRIRHARPVWLLEAFEAKVLESAPEKRDKHGLPPLYSKNYQQYISFFNATNRLPMSCGISAFICGTLKHYSNAFPVQFASQHYNVTQIYHILADALILIPNSILLDIAIVAVSALIQSLESTL
ncbi:hypothetical protein JR316_0011753 [Psilocybe cubensis]|uniref:Uncharacterized protein n=1 Tax=Psilocybe cubensis TaxID=181762 RepID=A0ACB8GLB1_PSICU|nr:hypothetical protein JR316_0011753 [Psilocybe cubensis]KAH9476182.1 hypothetical protein JR316_0011753 [Psilocybe cubensis]